MNITEYVIRARLNKDLIFDGIIPNIEYIILCSCCKKPAKTLDPFYPYENTYNRCKEHKVKY